MTKALPFTRAGLKRAILAAEACGKRVTGIRPDGTLILDDTAASIVPRQALDQNGEPPLPEPSDAAWGDVEA